MLENLDLYASTNSSVSLVSTNLVFFHFSILTSLSPGMFLVSPDSGRSPYILWKLSAMSLCMALAMVFLRGICMPAVPLGSLPCPGCGFVRSNPYLPCGCSPSSRPTAEWVSPAVLSSLCASLLMNGFASTLITLVPNLNVYVLTWLSFSVTSRLTLSTM